VKKAVVALVAIFTVMTLASCGYSVPSDMVAIQIGAGPAEASKVKGCKEPADRGFWSNDDYRYFPTSEREWDATGQDGSDSGRFKSVTDDSVEMYVPVTVRFTLITECDTLTDFYTSYGRRYNVEFKADASETFEETGAPYTQGWITVLRKLVADPTDATLDRIIQGYKWRDVWSNPETKVEIEKTLDESLSSETSLMTQVTNGESYFENISVIVGQPQPVNEELAQAVALEQTNVAKAQSAEAQAKADEAKALAEVAVFKAEAAKQRAEIAGYGGVENYLKALLIESGGNPFQPTYLYGGTP
jgi:hypothetical protein